MAKNKQLCVPLRRVKVVCGLSFEMTSLLFKIVIFIYFQIQFITRHKFIILKRSIKKIAPTFGLT